MPSDIVILPVRPIKGHLDHKKEDDTRDVILNIFTVHQKTQDNRKNPDHSEKRNVLKRLSTNNLHSQDVSPIAEALNHPEYANDKIDDGEDAVELAWYIKEWVEVWTLANIK